MKVLIIGDGCSDVFRYGTCDRISPEAPVPVMKPTRTTGNGGMAINVYENLK
jgi:bifunctional ADP-heptose synthase (sugar kinase/adenylyltransferase)